MATQKAPRHGSAIAGREEDALIERWIVFDRPTRVYLKESGVDVWAIIGAAGGSEDYAEQVAGMYEVPADAVRAAFAYYRRHPLQIDAKLEDNAWGHGETWPPST